MILGLGRRMRTRESGMPEKAYWESFFNVANILKELEIDDTIKSLVDFGAGYGTFTIPAAKLVAGEVHSYEIEPELATELLENGKRSELNNLIVHNTDFVESGSGIPDNSISYVMIFNILHAAESMEILKEAYRILKPGGKLGVIHWRYDSSTPRGPSMAIRPKPEELQKLIQEAGFQLEKSIMNLPPYHYGILAVK